jgi:hypothetical protein
VLFCVLLRSKDGREMWRKEGDREREAGMKKKRVQIEYMQIYFRRTKGKKSFFFFFSFFLFFFVLVVVS